MLCTLSVGLSDFILSAAPTCATHTLSLHDALPISHLLLPDDLLDFLYLLRWHHLPVQDRKSTRLNSSHVSTSYAVFCLKKKTNSLHDAYVYYADWTDASV